MQIEGIHHIAIIAADYEACKRFYTEVLGFEVIRETYRAERQSYKLDLSVNGQYQVELFSFPDSRERASWPEARRLRHLAFCRQRPGSIGTKPGEAMCGSSAGTHRRIDRKAFLFFSDPSGQPLELYEI